MSDVIRRQIKSGELAQLFDYWQSASDAGQRLSRSKINPSQICQCLPNTLIIDLTDNDRFRYRYVGTAVDGIGGDYLTNLYVDDVHSGGLCAASIDVLRDAVSSGLPSYFAGECRGADGMNRHFERIVLPLSSNGTDVDGILVGLIYVPVIFPPVEEFEVATFG